MNRQNILWLILTIIGAYLLKLSAPPVNFGFTILFAWVPAIIIAMRYNIFYSMCSGAIMACTWFSDLPVALVEWGWQLSFYSWLVAGVFGSSILTSVHLIARNIPSTIHVFSFPCVFVFFVFIGQTIISIPIALSPQLFDVWPEFFTIGKFIGFYGLEFSIAFFNSLLAYLISAIFSYTQKEQDKKDTVHILGLTNVKSKVLFSVCLITITVACAYAFFPTQKKDTHKHINIYAIQPAISHQDAIRAGNSLHHRKENEKILDNLTREALAQEYPGIVIWPEGGHNFPNLSLQRRREKMKIWLVNSESELLFTGYEVNAAGDKINTLSQLNAAGFGKTIAKAKLAPLAENHLQPGKADTITTRFAKLGVAICFEALFTSHFEKLSHQGAEAFIVVTDDSSFGKTYLYHRHLSYARVFSAIYQKPLLFLNNNGPSFLTDDRGIITSHDLKGEQPHVNSWVLETYASEGILETHTLHHLTLQSILLILLLLIWQSSRNKYTRQVHYLPTGGPQYLALCFLSLILSSKAPIADLYLLAKTREMGIREITMETLYRYTGEAAFDAIAPLFKQRNKSSCGAAALAYALHRMGDTSFEMQLVAKTPPQNPRGYNLAELKLIAESRGFLATAYKAELDSLPKPGQQPSLVHWLDDHYVTVIQRAGGEVVYFDPALGEIIHVDENKFHDYWSGVMLSLSYDDRWLNASLTFDDPTTKLAINDSL